MPKVKVDLLSEEEKTELRQKQKEDRKIAKEQYRPPKKYNIKKIIASIIIIIIICLAVFSSSVIFSDENLIKNLSKFNVIEQVGKLIGSRNKSLDGEADDRINILLIGMGGKGHEGGTLADTIILASFKPSTNQVAMLSIPRDLSVPVDGYDHVKINALHAYAEKDEEGTGGEVMAEILSNLLETKINYFVTVDFSGFEKLIDEFDGIDIEVERDLIDPEYPIRGKEYVFPIENRYETLHIEQGLQHMDGELALKYSRSRHAIGIEGSDFARSRRQQKILAALKGKFFSVSTILNPKRISSLLTAYNDHIYTNLEVWEMIRLAQLGKDVDTSKIISQTLSNGPNEMLYSTFINSAYVLLPNDNNYSEIKDLWQNIFYSPSEDALTSDSGLEQSEEASTEYTNTLSQEPENIPQSNNNLTIISSYKSEGAKIEIRNGTWINGYAGKEKIKLEERGFEIISTINADNHDYKKTVIYDLSNGKFPETAKELTKIYNTEPINGSVTINSNANFVIILGED